MHKYRIYDLDVTTNEYELIATVYSLEEAKKYIRIISKGYIVLEDKDDPFLGKIIWSNK